MAGSDDDPSQKVAIWDELPWSLSTKRAFIITGSYPAFAPVQLKGGLGTDAGKHLSKSVYQRMDAELLAARQVGHLRALPAPRRLLSAHPLGGAAMADSAATGVVAHTGEVFGEPRLYVSDGAVLPRAPGVPPSLTIAALAERTADLVIQEARP